MQKDISTPLGICFSNTMRCNMTLSIICTMVGKRLYIALVANKGNSVHWCIFKIERSKTRNILYILHKCPFLEGFFLKYLVCGHCPTSQHLQSSTEAAHSLFFVCIVHCYRRK